MLSRNIPCLAFIVALLFGNICSCIGQLQKEIFAAALPVTFPFFERFSAKNHPAVQKIPDGPPPLLAIATVVLRF